MLFFMFTTSPLYLKECSTPTFQLLERFTVVMYDKSSPTGSVNIARRVIFIMKQRTLEKIPPTQGLYVNYLPVSAKLLLNDLVALFTMFFFTQTKPYTKRPHGQA